MRFVIVLLSCALGVSACASTTTAPTHSARSSHPPVNASKATHHKEKRHRHKKRTHAHHATHSKKRHKPSGIPAADFPNRALTPGVALPVGTAQICVSGYASATRDVSQTENDE